MDYSQFLNTATSSRWLKIGLRRRAGVSVPLFSVFSKESIGIGEINDIKLLADWCCQTGISILQLLPLNELGLDNAPYNSSSTFAIEPSYINFKSLIGIDLNPFQTDISFLKKRFPQRKRHVNYNIKQAKLGLLWKMFCSIDVWPEEFTGYCRSNAYWLDDFAAYKVIGEKLKLENWCDWDEPLKCRNIYASEAVLKDEEKRLEFHKWVQWQLLEQLKAVKKYVNEKGILLMGDLPFLVSRGSADVWAHQDYFNLGLSAGAPPDMYFALGQKWGMPPYNWYKIAEDGFVYLKERLRYAENFYDMYRIDHFVGLFRVWTVPFEDQADETTSRGRFEPQDERLWEEHGKAILNAMLSSSEMMPCAEDLGTVPPASYRVLYEYGIPGVEFQRYLKNQSNNFAFKHPRGYRSNSVSVISTHDSTFFFNWWKYEAGTIDEKLFDVMFTRQGLSGTQIKDLKKLLFNKKLSKYGRLAWNDNINSRDILMNTAHPAPDNENSLGYAYFDSFAEKTKFLELLGIAGNEVNSCNEDFISRTLGCINDSASIFSIQMLQEYLSIDANLFAKMDRWKYRINTPGTVSSLNWSILLPCSLEEMLELEINKKIKNLLIQTARA